MTRREPFILAAPCAHTDYECDCDCQCGNLAADCRWPECGCACAPECKGCVLLAEGAYA